MRLDERSHPIRAVLKAQGRTLNWLARQLNLSPGYLHQLLLPPANPRWHAPPDGFYPRVAKILGVSERDVRPIGATTHATRPVS